MAPPKFDDICKTAKDVLSDDYTAADKNVCNFKSKVKPSAPDGSTLTTAIDFDWDSKVAAVGKLTWKIPKPFAAFGVNGVNIDKAEIDKTGKAKFEYGIEADALKDASVKADVKTNWELGGTSVVATYTGINNALVKCELNAGKVATLAFQEAGAYSTEVSYAAGHGAIVALKHAPENPLSAGVNYVNGPAICSLMLQENFASKTFHGFYKVNSELKLACSYNLGGKKTNGQWAAGLAWNVCDGTDFKGKITGTAGANTFLSTAVKQNLAKGLAMTASSNIPLSADKGMTWGLQFSIE